LPGILALGDSSGYTRNFGIKLPSSGYQCERTETRRSALQKDRHMEESMNTRNRMIVLGAGLFSATLLVAGQTAPTVKSTDSHANLALPAAACPSPETANEVANTAQRTSAGDQKTEKAKFERAMPPDNDPSANDQPLATQQSDQKKSPWWEPRDWNYINSF
jgi:hypothetical protein